MGSMEIGLEIKKLSNIIRRRFVEEVECKDKDNITGVQRWIIRYVYLNKDKDLFQRDIEKEFHIRRSTATGVLQLLEKNGYIRKESVKSDGRLKKIVLTEKAVLKQEEIDKRIKKFEEKISKDLSNDDINNLLNIIDKIKKNLE